MFFAYYFFSKFFIYIKRFSFFTARDFIIKEITKIFPFIFIYIIFFIFDSFTLFYFIIIYNRLGSIIYNFVIINYIITFRNFIFTFICLNFIIRFFSIYFFSIWFFLYSSISFILFFKWLYLLNSFLLFFFHCILKNVIINLYQII